MISQDSVVIIGANSFLGARYCERLLEKGVSILATFSSEKSLESSPFLKNSNFEAFVVNFDRDSDQSTLNLELSKRAYDIKCAHILVFSGYHRLEPLKVIKQKTLQKMHDINYAGPLYLIKDLLKKTDYFQSITFTSSVAGLVPEKGLLAYGATKSAVIHSTKTLALELASKNIRVNCVSPGWIDTPVAREALAKKGGLISDLEKQYPLGLGSVDDLFGVYDFLRSKGASWMTGQNLVVDGGFSLERTF